MITLTFAEFRDGQRDQEDDFELYIIKRNDETLYVGISKQGVWNRWFGSWGHMPRNIYGEFLYNSGISREIIEHAPQSDNWIVELWTLDDCRELFQNSSLNLQFSEIYMIKRLQPSFNFTHARC